MVESSFAAVPPTLRPDRPPEDASLTLSTCCLMSEGTMKIMTTPSTAHSIPKAPSPTATQRGLELPPMSGCAVGARGAQGLKGTATETSEATEMTEASAAR